MSNDTTREGGEGVRDLQIKVTDAQLTVLAERFCAAPLPATVCADVCATRPVSYPYPRLGTNLLTVREAREVLRYVLEDQE